MEIQAALEAAEARLDSRGQTQLAGLCLPSVCPQKSHDNRHPKPS